MSSILKLITQSRNPLSCYRYLQKNLVHTSTVQKYARKEKNEPAVVVSEDGSTIFCWHPEPSYPYEHTKPLPRDATEMLEGDSVLKVQHLYAEQNRYRPDGPSDKELCEMFTTTIHPWRHQPEKRRIKQNPPRDRESV